jgi:hypothetical protein
MVGKLLKVLSPLGFVGEEAMSKKPKTPRQGKSRNNTLMLLNGRTFLMLPVLTIVKVMSK